MQTKTKELELIKYFTMNSWNKSTAPAYNLKVYNVIPSNLRNKVYELMECEDFYFYINDLINDFSINNDYIWQAGFNGRSGGYLVLYKGGVKDKKPFCYPGKNIELEEVPEEVLKEFELLAQDIVQYTIDLANSANIKEE